MTTTPVDVLAVMERSVNCAASVANDHPSSELLAAHLAESKQARAAVAELMEACAKLDDKAEQRSALTVSVFASHLTRLRAALARCGGAK